MIPDRSGASYGASPLDALRHTLDAFERSFATLGDDPAATRKTLELGDALEPLFAAGRAVGADVAAEEVRLENLRDQLRTRAPRIARQIGTPDAALAGGPSWRIVAAELATRRRAREKALFTIGLPIAIMCGFLLGIVFWPRPPQPNFNQIQELAYAGAYPTALVLARAEAAQFPQSYEAAAWHAAMAQASEQDATALWNQVYAMIDDPVQARFQRGVLLLDIGLVDAAETMALELVALPDGVVFGDLLQGDVYAARRQVPEAVEAFERSADAAQATDQPELEALARMRIALQLQRPPGPTATPSR
jgi:tetratricopeptide (TPR) repeat protein